MDGAFDPAKGGLVVAGQGIPSIYPKLWKNFSPRLGMSYHPKQNAGLVVRAGFSLFFDTPAIVPFSRQLVEPCGGLDS